MDEFDKVWALLKGQYMHPSVMGHFARGTMAREDADFRDLLTGERRTDAEYKKYPINRYDFQNDDTIDPAPYDPRKRTGPTAMPKAGEFGRDDRYDRLRRIARNTGFGNTKDGPLHRQEEKVRPIIREKALSYPQQAVDDFIARLYNPPTRGPFFKNPTEKELNDPYRLKPDTDGLKALEPGDIAGYPASKTGHSYAMSHLGNPRDRTRLDALRRAKQHHDLNYTDAEREAYFGGPYPLLAYGLNDPISRQGSEYYEPDKYEYELFDTDGPFDLAYNHLEQTTFKNYADLIPPDLKSRQL